MKILFLGLFYDEEGLKQSYKDMKGVVQMAPHRFQTLLLQGLEENGAEVQAVHVMPSGSFPFHHKKLFIKDKRWGKENYRIGYVNLPVFKQLTQEKKAYRAMKKALLSANPPDVIICYYLHMPFLKALNRIKKQFPQVKIVSLMTEAVPGRGDIVDTAKRKKLGDKMVSACQKFDGFCLITKHLVEPMEVGDRPYFVLEGLADEKLPKALPAVDEGKNFLYTGSVHQTFNLDILVEAFSYLPEATLWLCGKMQAGDEMRARIEATPNVRYLGYLPFEQVQEYRDGCRYLINPRMPTGTYTKYTFPSKTMEYLVSGKPMVGYLLEGIGEEYYPYINALTGREAKEIAEDLRDIMKKEYAELQNKADEAREFLLREKTGESQAKKMMEFLQKL